ncbi:MAG: hypothetical protein H6925_04605 [Holosporaceae bacterium]|nr:MAG: hypothetical protein H6925_04605 [Holosporaceae bacterium]
MLKIFTLCLAFCVIRPFVASAASGGEDDPLISTGIHTKLRQSVLTAAKKYILGGQFDPATHTDFANTVAPYLATVNANDVVTVLTRLNGASKLLDFTNGNTVTRVLAHALTWLEGHREVEAGADTDLLTAAVAMSEYWDDDVVTAFGQYLGVVMPALESDEEEEDYENPDAAVDGLTHQMSGGPCGY